jgi:glycosidase
MPAMKPSPAPAASWPENATIYQVNLRSFAAREPRNPVEALDDAAPRPSPLAYLASSLPRIARLGFNTLYLLPPYPIGLLGRKGIGSPYASRDFSRIEPEYGTRAEMASLVRAAHKLSIKVLFDITPNHTARDHVWMAAHPDYYVRNPDGTAFFDCDWSDTAKLDYTNPAFRRAMVETLDGWLSFLGRGDGIDGYRFDMAHFINDRSFWDEALAELRRRHPSRPLLFLAECYGFGNNCDLFRRGMTAAYDDDFYKFSQYAYATDDATGESRLALSADAEGNGDFRPLLEAWRSGGPAAAAREMFAHYEAAAREIAPGHLTARYVDNHDEGRGLARFGEGAVKAMMSLAFFAPRTIPFVLCGEEFGALNRPSIHARCSACDKGPRVVAADGREWRREGVEFEGNVFARGPAARKAWYRFFQRLFLLRAKNPVLSAGAYKPLALAEKAPENEKAVFAFERTLGKEKVLFAVNLSDKPAKVPLARFRAGKALLDPVPEKNELAAFQAIAVRV